jgi:5'-deoxynucleotidase YfbR-like HD superfamily hydrolase
MRRRVEDLIPGVKLLADLALAFGAVERITYHPDRQRRESAATHTVMLIWVACSLAELIAPELDLGLIAQLAAVHDSPEALVGDTPTLKISAEDRAEKERRESVAREDLHGMLLPVFPWLPKLLVRYEERPPEARFVWAVDKLLPKLTHLLNAGHALREQQITRAELTDTLRLQVAMVRACAWKWPEVAGLLESGFSEILDFVPVAYGPAGVTP